MTETAIVHTNLPGSCEAGRALGWQIAEAMDAPPDAVILFASPTYEHADLLYELKKACRPTLLVGCSSAGEFTSHIYGEGLACAVALRSTEMHFAAAIGRGLSGNRCHAARDIALSFQGRSKHSFPFRSALLLTDALAGYTDDLVAQLTQFTGGTYQFFGGGAGDNAQFRKTPVFYGTEVVSDAVVALEILSTKPLGVGVHHGWRPASRSMRVTEVKGLCVVRLDEMPAVEVLQTYAHETGQCFDLANPLPFFLHNLIGIEVGIGYKLRVPLAVNPDGSILCATDVPVGTTVRLMCSTTQSTVEAAAGATRAALQNLYGCKPAVGLFFGCVATRLRLGEEFGCELEAVQHSLGSVRYAGCNAHGQIARAEGQFSGFHNCTAVVCLIPE